MRTLEAALARVVEDVTLQLGRLDEALATVLARVRLDARVRAHVPVERLLGGEARAAVFALVGLLARVDAPVFLVGADRGEVFVAEVALVRTLARVGS